MSNLSSSLQQKPADLKRIGRQTEAVLGVAGLSLLLAETGVAHKLEDHGTMNQSINCGHGGHGVLEDPIPLGEHEV